MPERRAQWFDPIAPVERAPDPDPCERVELVLRTIELLRQFDLPHALEVADGLARWLEGGDLARALGLRVRRGQRAPMTMRRLRERDDQVRRLADGLTPAEVAREIQTGTARGRRLRELGAPDSPRHLSRILSGTARRHDTSS